MTNILESFEKINSNINELNPQKLVRVVAVSKTFSLEHIKPLIDFGHKDFGENKVQEAVSKWEVIKQQNNNIKLHMVGKLQSNKAKTAFKLFDYIHSLDNRKLADIFSKCEKESSRKINYFIQVNVGNELQKSGIKVEELDAFFNYCSKEKNLNILGLMAIPPNDQNVVKHFSLLNELNSSLGLKELSMGMSSDYALAIKNNATFIRIGSSIFGSRS